MTLADLSPGDSAILEDVGGDRAFRRRLMELGFVPSTAVRLLTVAPLGDPLQFEVRHCRVSIRRRQARAIKVRR
jgi:Fe2+ transport system protein FeoA